MKLTKLIRGSIASLTCCGMLSAQLAQAAGNPTIQKSLAGTPASSAVRDLALEDNGVLRGQVLDGQGAPIAGIPVSVARQGQEIARAEADAQGRFAVEGLTPGVYHISTPIGGGVYRAWSPRTAPPAASQAALIVPDEMVVRGQFGTGALGFLANPWVLAAIVAAAIAIPLALDDDDDAS